MRGWMVVGNWKMNCTRGEAVQLARAIKQRLTEPKNGTVAIAPPFTCLADVYEQIKDSPIRLCAQNLFYEDKGAFTGEISAPMLLDCGCSFVILGHSERRRYFSEGDDVINKKLRKALAHGLKPILCVGETLDERERQITEFVVALQVRAGLYGVDGIQDVTIAYEPVWAIGTGKNATPAEAQEVQRFIRNILLDRYGEVCLETRILYGGSVTEKNVADLVQMEDIDGVLVGGASLKTDAFVAIIEAVQEVKGW